MYGNYEQPLVKKDVFKSVDDEDVDNIRFYIADGADPDMKDEHGHSLLIHAMINKKYHAAETLLEMGADPDGLVAVTGHSALHYAAGDGSAHMIGVLMAYKANINLADPFGYTPLHMATAKGKIESVQALVEHGADLTIRNKQDQRPLELAARNAVHVVESIARPFHPILAYLRAQMEDQGVEFMTREQRQAELAREIANLKSRDPGRFKLKM